MSNRSELIYWLMDNPNGQGKPGNFITKDGVKFINKRINAINIKKKSKII